MIRLPILSHGLFLISVLGVPVGGRLLPQDRDTTESEAALKNSVDSARRGGGGNADLAEALSALGAYYHDAGRLAEAAFTYEESRALFRRFPWVGSKVGSVLLNLASVRFRQGMVSDAEKLFAEAQQVLIASGLAESRERMMVLSGLMALYLEIGRFEEARVAGSRALAIALRGDHPEDMATPLFFLAKLSWQQERADEAEQFLRRALELWRRHLGPAHPTYAFGLISLAVVRSGRDPSEAGGLFREALSNFEKSFGPDHFYTGVTLIEYAKHLERVGSKKEARRLKRKGAAILDRLAARSGPGHTVDIKVLESQNGR